MTPKDLQGLTAIPTGELDLLLAKCAARELRARDIYQRGCRVVTDSAVRQFLNYLSEREAEHARILSDLCREFLASQTH